MAAKLSLARTRKPQTGGARNDLFVRYKSDPTSALGGQIEQLERARMLSAAKFVMNRYPHIKGSVSLGQLVNAGFKGLLEGLRRFDPSRGAAFDTFIFHRVRGAMVDELRELGLLAKTETRGRGTIHIPIDALSNSLYSPVPRADDLIIRQEALLRIRQALEHLKEDERTFIELYYFEGLTMEQAGDRLGVSKSWCSQLHQRALSRLRCLLRETGLPSHRQPTSRVVHDAGTILGHKDIAARYGIPKGSMNGVIEKYGLQKVSRGQYMVTAEIDAALTARYGRYDP